WAFSMAALALWPHVASSGASLVSTLTSSPRGPGGARGLGVAGFWTAASGSFLTAFGGGLSGAFGWGATTIGAADGSAGGEDAVAMTSAGRLVIHTMSPTSPATRPTASTPPPTRNGQSGRALPRGAGRGLDRGRGRRAGSSSASHTRMAV